MSDKNNRRFDELRIEYTQAGLDETQAGDDPFQLFDCWFKQACTALHYPWQHPNAMTLTTASQDGTPAARVVLLKDYDQAGFVFYTNYNSDKTAELEANPKVALVFFWEQLEQQIRITGTVTKIARQISEDYFATRPTGSQIGAWVSDQSTTTTRKLLQAKLEELEKQFKGKSIPCPPHWGGYCVKPTRFEFWAGQPNRLHDRILFVLDEQGQWKRSRLSP